MVIPSLKVLEAISRKFVENNNHQKDAQRNSVQKDVLNSPPSFFSASLVKKTLMRITSQEREIQTPWNCRGHAEPNRTEPPKP